MKWVWLVLCVALAAGVYFQPGPDPGQGALDYILNGRETWQTFLCAVIASICGSILIMAGLMRDSND